MATPDLSKMDVNDLASELMAAAEKIYDTYMDDQTPLHQKDHKRADLLAHIASVKAELSRRMTPPPGCVRLPDGRDVEVLGGIENLPMTADGCLVTSGGVVWGPSPHPADLRIIRYDFITGPEVSDGDRFIVPWDVCYSTPEAAEAARSSK
jgi:hypothetical protein